MSAVAEKETPWSWFSVSFKLHCTASRAVAGGKKSSLHGDSS